MQEYHEAPDTRLEQGVLTGIAAVAVLAAGWLVWRIVRELEQNHTPEFIALTLLLGLVGYLAWLALSLRAVRYTVADGWLVLRQGRRQIEFPLHGLRLHRWRRRWAWSGGARQDLGVGEVALYPAFWLRRGASVWVLLETAPGEEPRAFGFRPSPALLAEIRAWLREREGSTGWASGSNGST